MVRKILIVEDERIIAEDIKKSLVNYQYEVVSIVSNGNAAIAAAKEKQPDMILMDIKIEGDIDGIETAKIIKKEFQIPIVYLTANADEATLERAKDTQPYGYIVKPFEEIDLNATLQIAFSKHHSDLDLIRSEKRFKKLIEENTDGIAVIDKDKKILFVNQAFEEIFCKTREELINSKFEHDIDKNRFELEIDCEDQNKILDVSVVEIHWENEIAKLTTLRDITERKKAQLEVEKSAQKLQKLLEDLVNGLVSAIEMRDPYTAGHQRKVAELACAIGRKMNLSEDRVNGLRIASLVHDIGKIQIPAEILSKPGKLSDVEYEIMKSHAQAGYEILKGIDFPWPIAQTVLQHHVRMEGISYPDNIEYDEIILESKILSVADVVEAMSSHRPYRPARKIEDVLDEIRDNRGSKYDAEVVDACIKVFKEDNFSFSSL
ncbi:MAG: response regulator [Candidatus Cloacimonetes bacterium]|nr:response regulator [Candidatus Cloacimonadota bacterium]MCF7815242.1 response regulator [Candidatus Cloacimonadota bacterium]MCF7869400.1 response regulator [Candidatus Cloacimonadota bacterium]MCF7884799.1 response regulator [Candidatus Cloacimonadota bacterium]